MFEQGGVVGGTALLLQGKAFVKSDLLGLVIGGGKRRGDTDKLFCREPTPL